MGFQNEASLERAECEILAGFLFEVFFTRLDIKIRALRRGFDCSYIIRSLFKISVYDPLYLIDRISSINRLDRLAVNYDYAVRSPLKTGSE
mgnify:CR=1 FL=1